MLVAIITYGRFGIGHIIDRIQPPAMSNFACSSLAGTHVDVNHHNNMNEGGHEGLQTISMYSEEEEDMMVNENERNNQHMEEDVSNVVTGHVAICKSSRHRKERNRYTLGTIKKRKKGPSVANRKGIKKR